ncbi:hypothetical protein BP6252_10012 [Coleophoma cylindrospora]|uniref:Major facilitator superfamily (MFS) profile domain-containing protein n=1 Tax=Coleophoma cylindrospora TaxID=1849047 RepID=A0A3D8QX70_9HELO|nr:hypothetical protein BP6252_10012 [Coleophoma cylindrospora]
MASSKPSITPVNQEQDVDSHLPSPQMQYITGVKLILVTGSLTAMVFIMTLNASVVATAIPSITSSFHSINDIGWYGTAYVVSTCVLQPLSGKIYTLYSSKYTFLTCLCIFELGSLISGISRNSDMLIVGRAITGVGGSGLVGGAYTILGASCPLEKRPTIIGIVTGVGAVGQIIGPLIGGALTQHLSWRWCFYLNLPVGAPVFFFFLFLQFPDSPKSPPSSWRQLPEKLDLVGFLAFAPAILMILLAFQWGGSTYPWNSPTIIGLFIGGAALIMIFGFLEHRRGETAMIPLALLKERVVYCACLTTMLQMGALMALSYYMPTWFQLVKEDSPTTSGVSVLPSFGSQIVTSVVTGALVTRCGYYIPFAIAGSAISTIGAGLFTTFTPHTPSSRWIGYQILTGMGRGLVMQQPITALQANTPRKVLPIVSALIPLCQYFGTALFVSLGTTVFTNTLTPALQMYAPGVDPKTVISAGATGIKGLVSSEELPGVLLAANKALTDVFYLAVAASCLAFISCWGLGWKNIKEKRQEQQDVEGGGGPLQEDKGEKVVDLPSPTDK